MKLSNSKIFSIGPLLEQFTKAGIDGKAFVEFLVSSLSEVTQALRSNLTFPDNMNCIERELTLEHERPSLIGIPEERAKTQVKHVLVTQSRPMAAAVESYNWQYDQTGKLSFQASFKGAPTEPVIVKVLLFF